MRVVIALDGSHQRQYIVDTVAGRKWDGDTRFTIISVAQPFIDGGWVSDCEKSFRETSACEGAETLKKRMPEHVISYVVRAGNPAQEIVQLATSWQADLVIVGSNSRQGLDYFFVGSVAEEVVHQARCSVEVVKPPYACVVSQALNNSSS